MSRRFSGDGLPAYAAVAEDDLLLGEPMDFPDDPVDPRFTLDGAALDKDAKIDLSAYTEFMSSFAGEPLPELHPYPDRPGVRAGEEVPRGMRMWDSVRMGRATDSAGWIAARSRKNEPKKEKGFNVRVLGSWRLAFLLARLQHNLWEKRGASLKAWVASNREAAEKSKADAIAAARLEMKASQNTSKDDTEAVGQSAIVDAAAQPTSTPQKRRRRTSEGSSQKRARKEVQSAVAGASPKSLPAQQKASLLGPNALTGSVRLQQILAARQAQSAAAEQKGGLPQPPAPQQGQ